MTSAIRIYIAGSSDELDRASAAMAMARAAGFEVTHDWVQTIRDSGGVANPRDVPRKLLELWSRQCFRAVDSADWFWLLAPEAGHARGAFWELGVATATGAGTCVSGASVRSSIFTALCDIEVSTDAEAVQAILAFTGRCSSGAGVHSEASPIEAVGPGEDPERGPVLCAQCGSAERRIVWRDISGGTCWLCAEWLLCTPTKTDTPTEIPAVPRSYPVGTCAQCGDEKTHIVLFQSERGAVCWRCVSESERLAIASDYYEIADEEASEWGVRAKAKYSPRGGGPVKSSLTSPFELPTKKP